MVEPVHFPPYEVLRRDDGSADELGRGAMGVTYKALDTRDGSIVALKVIQAVHLGSDRARRRFAREARTAAALQHPNIARVFHQGEQDGGCFYAMEFIDGETLLGRLQRDGALPTLRGLALAREVAGALEAAAAQGLVHRDIKPSNLMLGRNSGVVKLIDFGLAKHAADQPSSGGDTTTLTHAGFLGTPHFASPEQLEERELDARSDIYSLGATLYFALTGRTPYTGSLAQVMSQHLRAAPPREGLAGQPAAVVALIDRMMAKDPAGRPATPTALLAEIDACVAAVTRAHTAAPGGAPLLDGEGETITDVAPETDDPPALAAGTTLAGRFALLDEYRPGEFGRTFRSRNLETGEIVAVLILDRRLLPTSEAYTRLENEVNALQSVKHPAVLRVHSIEWARPVSWVSREWVDGPSLLETMRRAGGLPLGEALEMLTSLAGGLDAVQKTGVPCPELAAQWITLVKDSPTGATLPKFNALGFSNLSPAPSAAAPSRRRRTAGGYVTALAALAYEMFGGSLAGHADGVFVPIPALPGEANLVLRRALGPGHGYATPVALVAALDDAIGAPTPTTPPRPPRFHLPAILLTLLAAAAAAWALASR